MISELDNRTRMLFCANMNEKTVSGNDWGCLATLCGFTPYQIVVLEESKNPTDEILSDWSSSNPRGSTISALKRMLELMDREDMIEILERDPDRLIVQSSSNIPADHINHLNKHVRETICLNMNLQHPLGYDWKALAQVLGIDRIYMTGFERSYNPTDGVLNFWGRSNHSTIPILKEALKLLQREDMVVLLNNVPSDKSLSNTQLPSQPCSQPSYSLVRPAQEVSGQSSIPYVPCNQQYYPIIPCVSPNQPYYSITNPSYQIPSQLCSQAYYHSPARILSNSAIQLHSQSFAHPGDLVFSQSCSQSVTNHQESKPVANQQSCSTHSPVVIQTECKVIFPKEWTRTPIKLGQNEDGCPICLEFKKEVSLQPCGHTMCMKCARDTTKQNICHICKRSVEQVIGVYI